MSPLYLHNNKLLVIDGKLATSNSCCCNDGGACCLPATCCIEGTIDWGDTPSESWGTPPGWVWIGVLDPDNSPSNVSYRLCIPDTAETPCDINATHWQAATAALVAWVQDQGLPSENVAWSGVSSAAASCEDGLTQSACESQSGTWHPNKTCAEEPCSDGCFERALLGDEAYIDGWCANAASSVGFAGQPCESTTATCGARTLVNEYSPGFGDWIVTVCCDNPLP